MPEIEKTEAEWRDLLSPEQYAVLRQAGRVHQRAVGAVDALVQPVDQRALVVGLEGLQPHAQFGRESVQPLLDLRERRRSVDVRLAPAEQVEVRTVQDEDQRLVVRRRVHLRTFASSDW